jgi:hypothetical protein
MAWPAEPKERRGRQQEEGAMLGTRGFRTGRKGVRGDDASTFLAASPAPADVPVEVLAKGAAHPQPISSLAGAGVAALDILPARSNRGLRRRRAAGSGAASPASSTALSPSSSWASSPAPVSGAAVTAAFPPPVPASGRIEPRPLASGPGQAGPLGDAPTAELPTVPSLFGPPPAEVADGSAPAAVAAPVTASLLASEPTGGTRTGGTGAGSALAAAVPNRIETEGVVAAEVESLFAGPGRSAVEPEPALSSLFAPAPAAMATVAEIVPTAATSAPAAAAEAPASLFAPAPADPESSTRETLVGPRVPSSVGPAGADAVTTSTLPVAAAAQSLRERSAMASEALSELSALSSYRSEGQSGTAAARRAPQATPSSAAQQGVPGEESLGARRGTRNAADVRSMLNGFRADGEGARTSAAVGRTVPKQASSSDVA